MGSGQWALGIHPLLQLLHNYYTVQLLSFPAQGTFNIPHLTTDWRCICLHCMYVLLPEVGKQSFFRSPLIAKSANSWAHSVIANPHNYLCVPDFYKMLHNSVSNSPKSPFFKRFFCYVQFSIRALYATFVSMYLLTCESFKSVNNKNSIPYVQ